MEIKQLVDSIAAKHAEIETALKATGTEAAAGKAAAEKALDEVKSLATRVLEAEQRLAERVKKGQEDLATLGKSAVESESVKRFLAGEATRGKFESKAPLLGQTAGGASSSAVVAPNRIANIIGGAMRLPTIFDVLPVMPTTSNLVEFSKESFFTDASGAVAEGAASGESEIGFELASVPVRTIATHLKVSKQVLADSPALAAYIDTRLTNALRVKVEAQVVAGDGNGQNLSGMVDGGNFTAFTPTAGEQALDSINRAIDAVVTADYAADVIVLNPTDWAAIQRLKTTDGAYLVGNPVGGVLAANLWGLPVVPCKAIPAGKVLVCSMVQAYAYFEREGVTIEAFMQDADNATRQLVTVQASTRGAQAAFRPASSRYGNLTA